MSTVTYLEVVNNVLYELNEVPLTTSTFPNAVGIHQFIKESVKKALYDINAIHYKWPFLAASTSTEPHLGNASTSTTEGVRWYLLKEGSAGLDTDYAFVDWDNFTLTTEGVSGETSPYTVEKLKAMSLEDWSAFRSEYEARDEANEQNYGQPRCVIRNPDGRHFGLSPIPKQEYKIYYYAWDQITVPTVYNSTFEFQDQWVYSVLLPRLRYYAWQFKENPQQAQMAEAVWKQGVRRMREQLIQDKAVQKFRDDRIRIV